MNNINWEEPKEVYDVANAWFQDAERELGIPESWLVRFGKWDTFKELIIDQIIYEYIQATENYQKMKEGMEKMCEKMRDIGEEMENAISESEMEEVCDNWTVIETIVDDAIEEHDLDMWTSAQKRKRMGKKKTR